MFEPDQIPDVVKAMANTGRILIVSVPSSDVLSKVKNALLEMRDDHKFVSPSVTHLFEEPSMLDEEQIIVLSDATHALTTNANEEFSHFMSIAQRRNYKAAVVALVLLDSYDSHAAQYCVNVRVA